MYTEYILILAGRRLNLAPTMGGYVCVCLCVTRPTLNSIVPKARYNNVK